MAIGMKKIVVLKIRLCIKEKNVLFNKTFHQQTHFKLNQLT